VHVWIGKLALSRPFTLNVLALVLIQSARSIGYRWANNLKNYNAAAEPQRFTSYYDSMAAGSAARLASAEARRSAGEGQNRVSYRRSETMVDDKLIKGVSRFKSSFSSELPARRTRECDGLARFKAR
jgi:hypothetical protein